MKQSTDKAMSVLLTASKVVIMAVMPLVFLGCDGAVREGGGTHQTIGIKVTVSLALHGGILNGDPKQTTLIVKKGESLKDIGIRQKLTYASINGVTRKLERFEHNKKKHDESTAITSDINLSVVWSNSCGARETEHPKDRAALKRLVDNAITGSTPNPNLNHIDTSAITDMNKLFAIKDTFNGEVGCWNTSKVENMTGMFNGAYAFNQDIGRWNTSQVENMSNMFPNARAFNQDIGDWNTSKVENMESMFASARAFNQDIGRWNTSKVENMAGMFSSADAFNQDIGRWNTSKVENMVGMFWTAEAFNQDISGWNVDEVKHWTHIFDGATEMQKYKSKWPPKFRSPSP